MALLDAFGYQLTRFGNRDRPDRGKVRQVTAFLVIDLEVVSKVKKVTRHDAQMLIGPPGCRI